MPFDLIRGRAIRRETPLYYLFDTDADGLPGFWVLEPKKSGIRSRWIIRVLDHLERYDRAQELVVNSHEWEKTEKPTLTKGHSYAYYYRGGAIRVIPEKSQVEISFGHPAMEVVANILCKLMPPKVGDLKAINTQILWVD